MVDEECGGPDSILSSPDFSDHVAFIAAPYGYGPVSKAVAISTYLPSSISCTFIGDGPSIELAQKSRAFRRCIRIDFIQNAERTQAYLSKFQVLVFINTTRFIGAWCKTNRHVIYVDTLAWLHGEPPPNTRLAHSYVGQSFFHHPVCDQLSRMATFQQVGAILPRTIVDYIRDPPPGRNGQSLSDAPLIHVGGLHSPSMTPGADLAYLRTLINCISAKQRPYKIMLPDYLHAAVTSLVPSHISILRSTPSEVASHIIAAPYVLSTPGIEFIYECVLLGRPLFFLPPFNGTQYIQLQHYHEKHLQLIAFSPVRCYTSAKFENLEAITQEIQQSLGCTAWAERFVQVHEQLDNMLSSASTHLLSAMVATNLDAVGAVGVDGAERIACQIVKIIN